MNTERANAVKAWFLGFAAKLGVTPVHGFSELWRYHIATVVHFLESGEKRVMEEETANQAYSKAMQFLSKASTEKAITEQLSTQSAAEGDQFEVVKFLVALMHEMRISHEQLLNFHYGLDPLVFEHLSAIFRHIDDQSNWDPVDSWPSILFQGLCADASVGSKPSSTPKLSRAIAPYFTTSQKCRSSTTKQSPLADILSSPRVREMRLLREKERELTKYRERSDLLECEKEDLEARLTYLNIELEKSSRRAEEKAALAERWEIECNSARAEVDELRQKLVKGQVVIQDTQKTVNELMQIKVVNEAEIRRLEYDNSEKADQLSVADAHNIGLTKTVAELRIQNEGLFQELRKKSDSLENLRRTAVATVKEKEELQMTLDSLRERIHQEERDHEVQMSLQMERCNDLVAQLSMQQRRLEEEQSKQGLEVTVKEISLERDKLREEIRQLRAQCSDLEKQLAVLRSQLDVEQARLTQTSDEKSKLNESLIQLQDSFKKVCEEKLQSQCRLATVETMLESREMEVSRFTDRVTIQENELKRLHEIAIQNMKQWANEKRSCEEQIDILKVSLQKAERDSEEARQSTMKQRMDLEIRLSSLTKENEAVKAELAALREVSTKRENELSSELAEKDLALRELQSESRDASVEASRQLAIIENQNAQLEKNVAENITTISALRSELSQVREKMLAAEGVKGELSETVRQFTIRFEEASLERVELDKLNEQLRSRLHVAEGEIREKREELCLLSKRFEDATAEITRIRSRCEERLKELEKRMAETKMDTQTREQSLKMQLIASEKETAIAQQLRKEIVRLKTQLQTAQSNSSQLEASLLASQDEVRKLKTEEANLKEESTIHLNSLRELMECEKEELTSKIAALQEKCNRLNADKLALLEGAAQNEAILQSELRHVHREHDNLWEEARELRSMYAAISVQMSRRADDEEHREARCQTHIDWLRSDRKEKEEIIRDLTRTLDTMRKKHEMEVCRKEEQISSLEVERENILRKLDEGKANLISLRGNLETVSTLLEEARSQNKEYERQLDRYNGDAHEKEEIRQRCGELEKKLDSERQEKTRLITEKENLEVELELERKKRAELREQFTFSHETFKPARDVGSLFSMSGAPHPVPEGNDEGDSMISTAMSGGVYAVNLPEAPVAQMGLAFSSTPIRNATFQQSLVSFANKSSDSSNSVDSVRVRELQRRNRLNPRHMRSAYPEEVSSRFNERDLHEDEFRDSENFVPPPSASKHKHGSANSLRKFGDRVVSKMFAGGVRDSPKQNMISQNAKKPFASQN